MPPKGDPPGAAGVPNPPRAVGVPKPELGFAVGVPNPVLGVPKPGPDDAVGVPKLSPLPKGDAAGLDGAAEEEPKPSPPKASADEEAG